MPRRRGRHTRHALRTGSVGEGGRVVRTGAHVGAHVGHTCGRRRAQGTPTADSKARSARPQGRDRNAGKPQKRRQCCVPAGDVKPASSSSGCAICLSFLAFSNVAPTMWGPAIPVTSTQHLRSSCVQHARPWHMAPTGGRHIVQRNPARPRLLPTCTMGLWYTCCPSGSGLSAGCFCPRNRPESADFRGINGTWR